MTLKPDLTRVWANTAPGANVVDPDTTTPGKVTAGWTAEVPPFEHFNFLQKWFTQGLAHANEEGIMVWDTDTTYPVNGLAKGSDGEIYRCVVSQNGNDPVSDGGVNWILWIFNIPVDTVADMTSSSFAKVGQSYVVKDYATGNGSGVLFFNVVAGAASTPDGGKEIDHDTLSVHFVQNFGSSISFKQYGMFGTASNQSAKLQFLFDFVTATDTIIDTTNGDFLIDNPVLLESNKRYKFIGNGNIVLGPSFAEGGANVNLHVMTLRGLAPRVVTPTDLFYNYWKETTVSDVPKGTRILISDNDAANYWDVGGNNYRNSIQTFVDYADTANDVLNFYPEINFPVPFTDLPTKEIDFANIVISIYEDDIRVIMDSGIKFTGDLNTLATHTARAYAKGLLVKRGRFNIQAEFIEVSDALRIEEAICSYQGIMQGGYSVAGGNGIKPVQGSTLYVDNSTITGFRHSIGVAGSTQDGASAYISNSVLTDARQSNNSSTYPQDESRALDGHGNAQIVQAVNCDIRGVQTGGGVMSISKSKVHTQINPLFEIRAGDAKDNGELYFDDCDLVLSPDIPTNADVLGGGIGTFDSTIYFAKDGGLASVATGWKVEFSNVRFSVADATNYPTSTILHLEPGNVDFARFTMKNGCTFKFGGTNIREIAIDPKVNNGEIDLGDTKFLGCGVTVGVRNSTVGTLWQSIKVGKVQVLNTDTTAGQFFSTGMQLHGDTTVSSNNRKISVDGLEMETFGNTAGFTMNACVWEEVSVLNSSVIFTDSAGTLGHAIRVDRNQNVLNLEHFLAHIGNNRINDEATVLDASPTIITGIQINGLNLSGSLPAGFFTTGTNAVKGSVTKLASTGTALAGV